MPDPAPSPAEVWCRRSAAFAVDRLVDFGLVPRERFAEAVEVVAEELWLRLVTRDGPPPLDAPAAPP